MADQNIPQTRRALRRTGPRKAEFLDEPIPPRGSSDVLIRVRAVSLNYKDVAMLDDNFPWPAPSNIIMGTDIAGEIVWVGDKVSQLAVGDRVVVLHNLDNITGREVTFRALGHNVDGALATHVVFEEHELVKFPDNLTWAELTREPGTGGVSILALVLAARAGATVIVTSSSDAKLERAKKLGASHVVNYKQNTKWEEEVLRLTGGLGVDIVIDQGGAATILQSLQSVKQRGQVSQVGFLSGEGQGDLFRLVHLLLIKVCTIVGIQVGSKGDLEDMMAFLKHSQLHLDSCIDGVYSFDKSLEAFNHLRKGAFGKVVIEL
ncbi:hypothetical protein Trco_003442 [Trichoderma cornu-damae]|uniref:Enoyl reductase (ER) domain-containing protein n=1 Tax=Trichoderma cornu-damae TaxID=654480 RepID=A0A9P8TW00_9HYPO|nr:hypothetical protein Trco_003442 [Trichoderma cornu-damae]